MEEDFVEDAAEILVKIKEDVKLQELECRGNNRIQQSNDEQIERVENGRDVASDWKAK